MTSLQRPALSVTLRPRDLVRTATLDDPFWRPILVFGQEPCGTFAKSCGSSVLPVLSNGVKLWRIAWTSVKDPFGTLAKKEPRGSFAKEQRRTFVESRGNSSEPLGTYVDKKKCTVYFPGTTVPSLPRCFFVSDLLSKIPWVFISCKLDSFTLSLPLEFFLHSFAGLNSLALSWIFLNSCLFDLISIPGSFLSFF